MQTSLRQESVPLYRPYAGIGSRDTPPPIYPLIATSATALARNGFTLRSGGARGADSLFEYAHRHAEPRQGSKICAPEIFRPENPPAWTYKLAEQYVDARHDWSAFPAYKKGLLARNMQQVLGEDGNSPALFVLYWTLSDSYATPTAGGTRYALRCAEAHKVPVLNLGRPGSTTLDEILGWVRKQLPPPPAT